MPINYQKTYDALSYEEGVEFRDLTIKVIQEIYPHYVIQPAEPQNPWVIYVANQEDNVRIQCPLRDLYNHFVQTARTKSDLKDTILNNYAEILKQVELDVDELDQKPIWSEVSDRVHPRLTRIEEFGDDLESLVHLPFGEGVVTAFVISLPEEGMVKWIRKDLLEEWNISFEDLHKKAIDNLGDVTEGIELVGTAKPHSFLWNEKGHDYAATSILLGGMRYLIAQTIGSPYRFCVPSAFVIYSWAELEDEEFQTEMRAMMQREHNRLPGRLSTNIYEVDEKGQIKQIKDLPENPKTPTFSNN